MHRFLETAHMMCVIERWNNRPNMLTETVAAHSFIVTATAWVMAAHRLADGTPVRLDEVLKRAVAHDLHEVITGDILAPTKRSDPAMEEAVRQLEQEAGEKLASLLPEPVAGALGPYVVDPMDGSTEGDLVGTADLFAAFLKAWLEVELGNRFHHDSLTRTKNILSRRPSAETAALMAGIQNETASPGAGPSAAKFLHHLVTLYYVNRWNNLPTVVPKSVAAHGHLVALTAWVLAEAENEYYRRGIPIGDVIGRALLLEAPKAITGDILYHARVASPSMKEGVDAVRGRAADELAASLPEALAPYFIPYLEPGDAAAAKLVEEAALVAAYMEVLMETRLGNTYFIPIQDSLKERLKDPYPSTEAVISGLESG